MNYRILLLNNEFPPLGGGTGTVNEHIIQELAKHPGVEIDLITSSLTKNVYEQQNYLPCVNIYKVPVDNHNIHHSTNRELLLYAIKALFLGIKLHRKQRYDICLAFSTVPAGGVAFSLWFLFRLPFFIRVSGPDIPGFEERYAFITKLLTPVIQLFWRSSKAVIVKCSHEKEMVQRVFPKANIITIRNGVDFARFSMARLDYLHSLTENGGVKFLCVARLIERKGHLHILKAVRLLLDRGVQGFKVILVGKGDLESSLMELAKKLEIEDYVDFRGYVNREVIAGVYAEADVFLLPSFNEGMSVAALEAIASGLPLLVTAESGLEGLIDNNGQVIHWGNIEELARAMEKFITNSDFRQSTGKCSMELAKNYTWNEVGNTYLELLIKSRNAVNGKINHQVI